METVVSGGSLLSLPSPLYIFVSIFVSVLPLPWLFLHFLHSFDLPCHPGCLGILYIWCFFLILYKNLSPSLFLLSFGGVTLASTCNYSTGDVLKMPVYILIPFLCMLLSCRVFSLPWEAVLYSWPPYNF